MKDSALKFVEDKSLMDSGSVRSKLVLDLTGFTGEEEESGVDTAAARGACDYIRLCMDFPILTLSDSDCGNGNKFIELGTGAFGKEGMFANHQVEFVIVKPMDLRLKPRLTLVPNASRRGNERSKHLGYRHGILKQQSIVDTIAQIVHNNVKDNSMIWFIQDFNIPHWLQVKVSPTLSAIFMVSQGQRFSVVVHDIVQSFQFQISRNDIQHSVVKLLHDGIVSVSVGLGLDQHGVSLPRSQVKIVNRVRLNGNTVNLHDLHIMTFNVNVLRDEQPHVDES
ncbi:hypothetical protein WICPIJ_008377 [Wickerhamomyces pijperi]|uniref:Uncharacterized protein n=1 Tax=Wickerhamomyces pijperi TaxID=599730 RepID=A0A9P8TIL5_WICPI|nr:hypothetical protein WICPIJ_008377 [Wickerhamomyces pijperi]